MSWRPRRRYTLKPYLSHQRAAASIDFLPVEVWKEIISLAIAPDNFKEGCVKPESSPCRPNRYGPCGLPECLKCLRTDQGKHDLKKLVPILLTCKFLYRQAIPFFYSQLYYEHPLNCTPSPPNGLSLHNTLEYGLALRQHCKKLQLFVKPGSLTRLEWEADTRASSISAFVTHAKSLVFHADLHYVSLRERSNYIWDVLGMCTAQMPALTTVSITRVRGIEMDISTVMRALQIPSIRKLSLNGSCNEYEKMSRVPGEFRKYVGTSEIKELELNEFSLHPRILKSLLSWPKELKRLRFIYRQGGLVCGNRFGGVMKLPKLSRMLKRQKESLVSLHIEHANAEDLGGLPDLTDFAALKDLTVFCKNLNPPPKKDPVWSERYLPWKFESERVMSILAPSLQKFVFSVPDTIAASMDMFEDDDEEWLRCFAKLAQSKKIPLQEIALDITPHIDLLSFHIKKSAYPWRKIKAFCEELEGAIEGLSVTYVEPPISEEDWDYFTSNAHSLPVLRPFNDPLI